MSEETEIKKKESKWSTDRIMSVSAFSITIISLIALFYQLSLAREENELIRKQQSASVHPHLSQWYSNTSDGFKIIFGNKGVGPAFIKKVEFNLTDTTFYNTDHLVNHLLRKIYKKDSISIPASTSTFSDGYVLPANEIIDIIVIKKPEHIKIFKENLNNIKLEFIITYADVYGFEWTYSNKNSDSPYPVPVQKN